MVDSSEKSPRLRKEKVYQSFVLQKPLPAKRTDLKSPFKLLKESFSFFRRHWTAFSLLILVFFCVAFVLFLSDGQNLDLKQVKTDLGVRYGDGLRAEISTAFSLLPELINIFSQRLTQSFGWFTVLNLFVSLSLWWLIRNLQNLKKRAKIKVRDAIYFGPAQITPFALLAVLLFVQFLPALVIADFGAQLRDNEVLKTNLEQAAAVLVILTFFFLSFYWAVGGVFSLIIVSLPGARPLDAWQTSLNLTHRRRRPVLWRLLFILLAMIFSVCLLILPFVWLIPQWSEYLFYLIGLIFFIIGHIYCFLLYQDLLTAKTSDPIK